ncbi:MAG: hypothetical protein AAB340_01430 [Patescibacteria group bacterium]
MKKKNVTINDLAVMVQKGFNETATKSELKSLETKMDKRFDKIEKIILADYGDRIEKLEVEVKELKDLLAFK